MLYLKKELLEIKEQIIAEMFEIEAAAMSGMPAVSRDNLEKHEWYKKLDELAERVDDEDRAAQIVGFSDKDAAWTAMMYS